MPASVIGKDAVISSLAQNEDAAVDAAAVFTEVVVFCDHVFFCYGLIQKCLKCLVRQDQYFLSFAV